jgi:hypothetical protein
VGIGGLARVDRGLLPVVVERFVSCRRGGVVGAVVGSVKFSDTFCALMSDMREEEDGPGRRAVEILEALNVLADFMDFWRGALGLVEVIEAGIMIFGSTPFLFERDLGS